MKKRIKVIISTSGEMNKSLYDHISNSYVYEIKATLSFKVAFTFITVK